MVLLDMPQLVLLNLLKSQDYTSCSKKFQVHLAKPMLNLAKQEDNIEFKNLYN